MKKQTIILSFILISFMACSDNKNEIAPVDGEPTANELCDQLTAVYKTEDQEGLIKILDNWSTLYNSDDISTLSDIQSAVYQIYQAMYSPFDIGKLGEHEWGAGMYEGYEYAVIQNRIYYDLDYDLEYNNQDLDSIIDFRPPVDVPGKKILYLTDNYHAGILKFLGAEFNPLGTGSIMNPASPTEESLKRYQFLLQEIGIIPGHWGGYWHIETHPVTWQIHFNTLLTKAKASFRVGYMFGDAEFEKNSSNRWIMTSSEITGIE